jgi:hypothetical protein
MWMAELVDLTMLEEFTMPFVELVVEIILVLRAHREVGHLKIKVPIVTWQHLNSN